MATDAANLSAALRRALTAYPDLIGTWICPIPNPTVAVIAGATGAPGEKTWAGPGLDPEHVRELIELCEAGEFAIG